MLISIDLIPFKSLLIYFRKVAQLIKASEYLTQLKITIIQISMNMFSRMAKRDVMYSQFVVNVRNGNPLAHFFYSKKNYTFTN